MRSFVEYKSGIAALHIERAVFLMPLMLGQALLGQILLTGSSGGPVRIIPTDSAVLEMQEVRKDLACTVTPAKAPLGFDLRFHSGYDVTLPLKELAGSENLLTILFRVTSDERKDDPTYFMQRIRVPEIEENASGEVQMGGAFDLGVGKYHVDWLMRDEPKEFAHFTGIWKQPCQPRTRPSQWRYPPRKLSSQTKSGFWRSRRLSVPMMRR